METTWLTSSQWLSLACPNLWWPRLRWERARTFSRFCTHLLHRGNHFWMGGRYERSRKQIVEQVLKGVAWHWKGRQPPRVPWDLREPEDGEPAWDNCRADLLEEGQSQYFPRCITFSLSQGVAASTRSNTKAGKWSSERAAHKDCLQETPMTHFAFWICFRACLCLDFVFVFVSDVVFVFIWTILRVNCTQNALLRCSTDSLQFPWKKMQPFHARTHDWQVSYAFLFQTLLFAI